MKKYEENVLQYYILLEDVLLVFFHISLYPLPSENHPSNLALSTSLHYRIAPVNFSHTIAPNNAKSPRMKYARISLKRFFIGSNLVLLQDKCCMFHSNQYHDCGLAMSVHNPRILVYQDCR